MIEIWNSWKVVGDNPCYDATWCYHLDPRTIEKLCFTLAYFWDNSTVVPQFPICHSYWTDSPSLRVFLRQWDGLLKIGTKNPMVFDTWMLQIGGPWRICKFHTSLPVQWTVWKRNRLVDPMSPVHPWQIASSCLSSQNQTWQSKIWNPIKASIELGYFPLPSLTTGG